MSDYHQIQSLMNDYCTAIDHGDFKRFGELMRHADWLVEGEKPPPASSTNVILYEDGTPRTKHVISNIQINIADDERSATGHSYVRVYQQTHARPLGVIFAGEYFDRFEQEDGHWRFAERDIRFPLFGDLSGHLKDPQLTFKHAPVAAKVS
jgi:hypothetical protein